MTAEGAAEKKKGTKHWQAQRAEIENRVPYVAGMIEKHFEVSLDQLRSSDRTKRVACARALAAQALLAEGFSYPSIGDVFGGRSHSTIVRITKKEPQELMDFLLRFVHLARKKHAAASITRLLTNPQKREDGSGCEICLDSDARTKAACVRERVEFSRIRQDLSGQSNEQKRSLLWEEYCRQAYPSSWKRQRQQLPLGVN